MAKKKGDQYDSDGAEDQDYDEEPVFEDPAGFVDDVGDDELLGDFLKQKPCESDGVENVIVVDNIPVVGPARFPKLQGVLEKIFKNAGTIVNIHYPKDDEENTKGFAFIEFKNPEMAEEAVKAFNNYRLDKSHTLLVNLFSDFQKYSDIPKDWSPPESQPYKVQNDLYTFLSEPDAQDQFCVVAESTPGAVQVQFWHNTQPEPVELLTRERFTETYVKWSPLGTYIVTFHKQGVVIWGGSSFTKINKFAHSNTQYVDFSPCEQYLVTYGPNGQKIIIWDIRTGTEKRSFVSDGSSNMSMFRWSHDDKYVARMGDNAIHVYETNTFYLLDKKSIKVQGIRNFSWSPTDNIIAYWMSEDIDAPARVTLLEIPKKIEVRNKNLFNVADCKIHWQKSGDYLCVKVDRYSKSKKDKKDADVKFLGMFYNFEIFHMREKDIPVDSVEVKETILAFAWEPVGSKFSIIHGEPSNANVSFYEAKKGQEPTMLRKMEKKVCSHLFWSPRFGPGENPPINPLLKVHVFNYTNVDEFFEGKAPKLEVVDLGPYVFLETAGKTNVSFNNDGTITYKEKRSYQFLANQSNGMQFDKVVVPNIPMLTAISNYYDESFYKKMILNTALTGVKAKPFKVLPVDSFLWGYEDELLSLAQKFSFNPEVSFSKFGILMTRNGTSTETFTIYSGENDLKQLAVIKEMDGKSKMEMWTTDECNRVDGTDGSQFPPHLMDKKQTLYVFIKSLCRKFPLQYEKDVILFDGIPAWRYKAPLDVFSHPSINSDNQCFCDLGSASCPSSGLLNATMCSFGAPIYASFPHFYTGDKKLLETVDGLKPQQEKHETFADIHPRLAFPIDGASRFQINVQVKKTAYITGLEHFQDDQILPVIWLEVVPGEISEELRNMIYHSTFSANAIQLSFKYGSLFVCLASLALLTITCYFRTKKISKSILS